MKVPEFQPIRYSPNILQSLIELFVQYLAILIPTVYILYYSCLDFAFNRQVLYHKETSEIEYMLNIDNGPQAEYAKGSKTLTSRFDF